MRHYLRMFEPLNDCLFAQRTNTAPGRPGLIVMRILTQRPDGQLMQVLATIGASATRLPRREGIPNRRNEYVTFLPANWDVEDPKHRWIIDMLADISDFTATEHADLYYADRLDMRKGSALRQVDEDVNMAGCMMLLPLDSEDDSFISCRTGLFTRVNIVHAMPITTDELEMARDGLRERFYPESGDPCYISARNRSPREHAT